MGDDEGVKSSSGTWMTILATYRIGLMGDAELVVGKLREDLETGDPLVTEALRDWDGPSYLANTDSGVEVALLRPSPIRAPRPWLIHGVLLLLTFFTTFMAGALLSGIDPLATKFVEAWGGSIPVPTTVDWGQMATGAPFALTLMTILMAHEMGHFLMARRHRVPASLPYFIPFPAYFSAIGTLGGVHPHTGAPHQALRPPRHRRRGSCRELCSLGAAPVRGPRHFGDGRLAHRDGDAHGRRVCGPTDLVGLGSGGPGAALPILSR